MVTNRIDDFFDDDSQPLHDGQEVELPKTLDDRIEGMKHALKTQRQNRRLAVAALQTARDETSQQRDRFDMQSDAPSSTDTTAVKIQCVIAELESLNDRRESKLKNCELVLDCYDEAIRDLESNLQEARRIQVDAELLASETNISFTLGVMLGGLREVAKELGESPKNPLELLAFTP